MSIYNDFFYIIIITNMNFIIRNLWWILLIIFFVFMLYLISNQNNTKELTPITSTWVAIEEIQQSDLVEEIVEIKEDVSEPMVEIKKDLPSVESDIVELNNLENSNDVVWENIINVESDVENLAVKDFSEKTSTGGIMNSIRDFFTIKKTETFTWTTLTWTVWVDKELIEEVENELSGTWMIEEITKWSDESNNEIEKTWESIDDIIAIKKIDTGSAGTKGLFDLGFWKKDTIVIEESNEIEDSKVVSEKSTENEIVEIAKDENTQMKKNEETKHVVEVSEDSLGKHEVWVKSMFLNNAWFTKRTWILYKGDTVEQLTATNRYGCFKIKVLSSSNPSSNGKIAWACKYYMVGHQGSLESYKKAAYQYYNNVKAQPVKHTKHMAVAKKSPVKTHVSSSKTSYVWKVHSVNTHTLKLNNEHFNQTQAYLLKGDKVEQISQTNASWCFKASVYSSKNPSVNNTWKVGWVCQKYLK